MSIGKTLFGLLVLATCSVVFAQTTETKPPDAGSSGPAIGHFSATQPTSQCGTEILTDTMGVDFYPYLKQIVPIIRKNWYTRMPPSVYPPISKQGKVAIKFFIRKDGTISAMARDVSSNDVALDRSAWGSITMSAPFPPLPDEFHGQSLGLRFCFYFNPELTGIGFSLPSYSPISISPGAGIRVPTGSTRQFSASGKGITEASVTWSVSGSGCSKSACGTISDTGLYTAPVDIPNPAKIIVEATSRTDWSSTGRSEVTIVQADH